MRRSSRTRSAPAVLLGSVLVMVFFGACHKKTAVEQVEVARITVEEIKDRMDRGEDLAFVDSRSSDAWEAGVAMIPGAVRVPPDDIDRHLSDVPRGKPVIVYCT